MGHSTPITYRSGHKVTTMVGGCTGFRDSRGCTAISYELRGHAETKGEEKLQNVYQNKLFYTITRRFQGKGRHGKHRFRARHKLYGKSQDRC